MEIKLGLLKKLRVKFTTLREPFRESVLGFEGVSSHYQSGTTQKKTGRDTDILSRLLLSLPVLSIY